MKKLISLLLLALTLLALFTACGGQQATQGGLTPSPPPEKPEYVPDPLSVEFFNTNYAGMSPWTKYPNHTVALPEADETPTEDAEQ